MTHNWGPHYIVPSAVTKSYSGAILLRENFDDDLLHKEFEELGITGSVVRVTNPWYYRRKNSDTWIKIGESENVQENFPARWDTTILENGQYEIMGLMHVFVHEHDVEKTIARQNIVEVAVEN